MMTLVISVVKMGIQRGKLNMKYKLTFLLLAGICLAGSASAQRKTVTNSDLEKFREKRIQAEKNLDDYYSKIGLSRADVEKRNAEDEKARVELSARLRAMRLERERAEAEARISENSQPQFNVFYQQTAPQFSGYILYGDRWYPTRPYGNRRSLSAVQWRATPGGIIYEPGSRSSFVWPAPVNQRPTWPAWRNPRSH